MESFKIDHFEVGGEKSFPKFKSLNPDECSVVAQKWRKAFSCRPETTDVELMKIISLTSQPVAECSSEDADFDLALLLAKLKIIPREAVYLNWHRFDKVDEMLFRDLCENLDDIWYPASDDLDIFDSSFTWIISIAHYGGIAHWRDSTH